MRTLMQLYYFKPVCLLTLVAFAILLPINQMEDGFPLKCSMYSIYNSIDICNGVSSRSNYFNVGRKNDSLEGLFGFVLCFKHLISCFYLKIF